MTRSGLPDLRGVKRVLIIRLGAIGDVIHALPLASALKQSHPHLEITWLVEEIPADVVIGSPDLHRVIVVPRSRWKRGRASSPRVWLEYLAFLRELRRQRFDVTIDLQGYAKSALYALASGARYRLGWWRLRDGSNLVSRPVSRRPESIHRIDWFLDVARALGIDDPVVRFPIEVPDDARRAVRERLAGAGIEPGAPYAVINQAAGNPPRRWGISRFAAMAAELARRYRIRTVLVGTAPEFADCDQVVRRVAEALGDERLAPVNLAGATNLKEVAALLDGCAIHVSGDTGTTHLAAALKTPVVAIYGSTEPAHAGPWGQSDHVLARRDLCSPHCTIRRCAYAAEPCHGTAEPSEPDGGAAGPALGQDCESARCLAAISVADAMALVERILGPTDPSVGPRFSG